MSTAVISLLLGCFYTCSIGFLTISIGIASNIFAAALLLVLGWELKRRQVSCGRSGQAAVAMALVISLSPAINTNRLVLTLAAAALCVVVTWLAVGLLRRDRLPVTAGEYFAGLLRLPGLMLNQIWRLVRRNLWGWLRRQGELGLGLVFSLPVVVVLHVVFASLNAEYASATYWVLETVLNPSFWELAAQCLCQSMLVYALLTAQLSDQDRQKYLSAADDKLLTSPPHGRAWSIGVFPIMVVISVFALFQGKLIASGLAELSFKEISLYAQHGFRRLLLVVGLGYMIWVFVQRRGAELNPRWTVRRILLLLLGEILLIAAFAGHKIVYLQYLYGLKDSRILATAAVVLIVFFLALCCVRTLGCGRQQWLFTAPLLGFLAVVSGVTVINLEGAVTRWHPISYYSAGQHRKDYAYL